MEGKEVLDTRPLFKGLVSDWLQRLREAEPYTTSMPREGLFPEEAQRISDLYQQTNPLTVGVEPYESANKEFYENYRTYADKIRPVLREMLPSIQERFRQFNKNTGIEDYTPVSSYTKDPGSLFAAAKHEIYAHELPYSLGFMPDYRAFDTGRTRGKQPIIYGPNSVTPINEQAAVLGEIALNQIVKGKDVSGSWMEGAFQPSFTEVLRKEALANLYRPSEKELVNTRFELMYPIAYKTKEGKPMVFPIKEDPSTLSELNEIGKLYLDKYIRPAAQQFEGAIRTQFPTGTFNINNYEYSVPRFGSTLRALEERYKGPDRPSVFQPDSFFLSADPIGTAVRGAQELTRGVRRTPSALLPGAADLIPSPEAIRTGYQQGPAAMGRQMATEFVQSLPAAAASAAVLATPVAAPLAPGIGAGMVGVAGTRALNEVVRQQTGEGVVPKLRQVVGTAPRTGVASPQRRGPAVTPQIRPLNQAQRAEMQRRQNRNELQRRVDLVRERFNPMRGEFGVTELLFGR